MPNGIRIKINPPNNTQKKPARVSKKLTDEQLKKNVRPAKNRGKNIN